MSTLKDLTIIIPTYKRTEYIKRSIAFWNEKEVNVLILDGSEKSIIDSQELIISSNINYIHSFTTIANRLKIAMNMVDTKYCVLLGDDEFFVPTAMESAIQFLDSYPEYIACGGQCIGFSNLNAGEIGYRLRYPEFKNFDLNIDNGTQRVITHFTNYTPAHIYAIMRTAVWKRAIWPATQDDFAAYGLAELAFEFIASCMGKCKMTTFLYWFRSRENGPNLSSEKSTNPSYQFDIWWKAKKYQAERERFRSLVIEALNPKSEKNTVKETFDLAFSGYYVNTAQMATSYRVRRFFSKFRLLRSFETVIFHKLKNQAHNSSVKKDYSNSEILELLESKGIYVDSTYFSEITKIVSDFHYSRSKFHK